ncbi:hypothetical protein [Halosimplex carlsbadense]|uniref:hypothetical protein n=1 Tax=Halosimplex carlsbadense TaxID=171164 RepID=UPI001267BEF0|nr:hypothetical protein [Halosimplex carlsbadense]
MSQTLWTVWPAWTTFAILGLMAIITGYRRAAKPDQRSERFRKSVNRHHALFDEFRDLLMGTLSDGSDSHDEMQDRFDERADRRRELNIDSPDARSLWYYWIKYVRGEKKLQNQISTAPEMREAITREAHDVLMLGAGAARYPRLTSDRWAWAWLIPRVTLAAAGSALSPLASMTATGGDGVLESTLRGV